MSDVLERPPSSLAGSLGAGLAAGAVGGLAFLALGLAERGADVFAYWPATGFAAALVVRSAGLYPLLFGAAGLALGGAAHALPALRGGRRVFALVLGVMAAVTVLAHLTAWWQIDVLAGLPMDDPARRRAALLHAAAALAAGGATAGLLLRYGPRRPPAPRRAAAALAAAAALVLLGEAGLALFRPSDRPSRHGRDGRPAQVVVVGLDGVTLRVLSPLLRAGELPAFRQLMADGAWGTLLTYGTASSPRVWTSMATGKRVRDHGIDDFVTARDSSYRARPLMSHDRRARALWNVLSDFGRRVAVVNWLITYPPEAVDGYVVTRLALGARDRAYPPELDAELDALTAAARPRDLGGGWIWDVDRAFDVAERLLAKERLDFLAVYDHTLDAVEHRCWQYHEPTAFDPAWPDDPACAAEPATLLADVYRHVDRRLGALLERLDDDALVIVVSDHGQRAARRPRVALKLDRILERLGYVRLLSGGAGDGDGDGQTGGDRARRADRVDAAGSRAYTLIATPWTPTLKVNLNLRGREPGGVVDRAEAGELARRLAADLRAVTFDDGEPLFSRVTRLRDPGLRGPARAGAPDDDAGADLEVVPSRHARRLDAERRLEIGGERLPLRRFQSVTAISGDHDHQGVIFVAGPGVEPGFLGQRAVPTALHDLLWHLTDKVDAVDRLLPPLRRLGLVERATTLDLAPTVLYALGLPVAHDMAGRPVRELFAEPPALEWIASYEILDGLRTADEEEAPADEETLERLRALGYVD